MSAHRYWRLVVLEAVDVTGFWPTSFAEIQLRETEGGADLLTSSNTTGGGGGTWNGFGNAVDDDANTVARHEGFGGVCWAQVDFGVGVTKDIIQVVVQARASGAYATESPKHMLVYYSDNASSWYPAWGIWNQTGWGAGESRTFTKHTALSVLSRQYWRLLTVETADGNSGPVQIREMQLRDTKGGSDNTGSGTAIGGSNVSNPANAFDNDNTTSSTTSTGDAQGIVNRWTGYDFGSAIAIVEIALTSHPSDFFPTTASAKGLVECSADNANWVTMFEASFGGAWGGNETRVRTAPGASDPPNAPTVTVDQANSSWCRVTKSAFSDPNVGDTQQAWRVQIRRTSDSVVVYTSSPIPGTGNVYTIPFGELQPGIEHQASAQQQDNNNAWSAYGAWSTAFTTVYPAISLDAEATPSGVHLMLDSTGLINHRLYQNSVLVESWQEDVLPSDLYYSLTPVDFYCWQLVGFEPYGSIDESTSEICVYTQALQVLSVTDTTVSLRISESAATQVRYQTTLATDPTFSSLLDDQTLTGGDRFFHTVTGLTPATNFIHRAQSLVDIGGTEVWTDWTPTVSSTTLAEVPPADILSHWIEPQSSALISGNYSFRIAVEQPYSIVGLEIKADGGTWDDLYPVSAPNQYTPTDPYPDLDYWQYIIDTTQFDDGFYLVRFSINDSDVTVIEHYGFFIHNGSLDTVSWDAVDGITGFVKYQLPTFPLRRDSFQLTGASTHCVCGEVTCLAPPPGPPISVAGHRGYSEGIRSFGPVSPPWLASAKGIDISVTWYPTVNPSGFPWLWFTEGELVTFGLRFGPFAIEVITGVLSGIFDGSVSDSIDRFDWSRVGVDYGSGTVIIRAATGIGLGDAVHWVQARTHVGWTNTLTWTRAESDPGSCPEGDHWRYCCHAHGPMFRGIPMRLKVWPSASDPNLVNLYARVVQAPALSGTAGGRFVADGNIPSNVIEYQNQFQFGVFADYNCNGVEFYSQSYGASGSQYIARYSAMALDVPYECGGNVIFDATVDCRDVTLTALADPPVDSIRYRIYAASDSGLTSPILDTSWMTPEFQPDGLTAFFTHTLPAGSYIALIDTDIGGTLSQSDQLPFMVFALSVDYWGGWQTGVAV